MQKKKQKDNLKWIFEQQYSLGNMKVKIISNLWDKNILKSMQDFVYQHI